MANYLVDKLLMSGGVLVTDQISGAAFTMAGTSTTGALLGATAPNIGAGKYTSCKIANPLTAGSVFSVMVVVNTAWAGNDGVSHYLWDAGATDTANQLVLYKSSGNALIARVNDSGSTAYYKYVALTGTNWAAGTHIVIMTRNAAGTIAGYLDGVAFNITSGTARFESAVNANVFIGSTLASAWPITGLALCPMWGRVLTSGEITALSSLAAWSDLSAITASVSDKVGVVETPVVGIGYTAAVSDKVSVTAGNLAAFINAAMINDRVSVVNAPVFGANWNMAVNDKLSVVFADRYGGPVEGIDNPAYYADDSMLYQWSGKLLSEDSKLLRTGPGPLLYQRRHRP